jgi:large subunit ribosomal protein L24
MHIKKNDNVIILTGKDRGKTSIVLEVFPKVGKVKVKDIAILTKHVKAKRQGQKSGIIKIEGLIDASNVKCLKEKSIKK